MCLTGCYSKKQEAGEKGLTMGLRPQPCLAWDQVSPRVTFQLLLVSHVILGLPFTFIKMKLNNNHSSTPGDHSTQMETSHHHHHLPWS